MRFSLLLMAFGGSLAQSSVVPSWSVGGVTPDLPLILTAIVALRRGPEAGCLVGFAAGLFQDATGGGHEDAVGAQVKIEDLEVFRSKLEENL